MKILITICLCLLAVNGFAPVPVVPIGLANPRFGIVHSMSSTDYVAIEIKGIPHGIPLSDLSGSFTNGSVVTITQLNVTSNVLVTIINATNAALITDLNTVSNYLYGLISTNVTVAAGTNVVVGTNVVGNQTVYTISIASNAPSGGESIWTNDVGFVHLKTNAPIVIGTNAGPPAPLYIFSGITNDSMSGVEMDFAPLAGAGANRSGLYVWMSSGDAIGGYAPAIYGLSEGTTSNGFGAYCGSVPFGMLGKVSSAGSGDSVATIGNNLGSHLGVRYGVSGVAGGPINGNTNVGVFGSGGTNANVAVGVYAELANSISTATDAKYPRSAALILNNRQTAQPLLLAYTNSTYEVFSFLANGHMQLNSNDLYSVVAGTGIVLATNGTALTISGTDTNTAGNTNISGILASNNVRVAAGTATSVSTSSSGGIMIYTVGSLLDTNVIGTNTAGILASNNVRVAAGANVTVSTGSSGGLMIYTVGASSTINALTANFDSITVTNAFNRVRSLVPSTTLTTQIDFSTGPTAYYWTNMVTNITLQITNTWVGSVSNRVLDFFFTGATNTGPNYTVTFSCPNPSGLIFRWGNYSATNGGNAFAVTNNSGAGVSLTLWDTNLIEAYYSPTR